MSEIPLIITPDADEPETAQIYVDGRIGSRAYRFLLDTGAARSRVVADQYTATFPSSEKHDSSGVFAKSSEDLIVVPSLELGTIAKPNFPIVRMAQPDSPVGSLIGMDFLKDHRCYFRFDRNRLLVNADAEADYPDQDLLLDPKFHPYVDVQIGSLTVRAVWDTGASLTVVDLSLIQQNPDSFAEAGASTGTDSSGSVMETPLYVMAEARIGGHAFPPHRVAAVDLSAVNATLDLPMDLILGYNLISRANWIFDFPRRRWAIA